MMFKVGLLLNGVRGQDGQGNCKVELDPRVCSIKYYCQLECTKQYNGTAVCEPGGTTPSACFCVCHCGPQLQPN